jgi:hypothetical protein
MAKEAEHLSGKSEALSSKLQYFKKKKSSVNELAKQTVILKTRL